MAEKEAPSKPIATKPVALKGKGVANLEAIRAAMSAHKKKEGEKEEGRKS
jgi:hypothetical protein